MTRRDKFNRRRPINLSREAFAHLAAALGLAVLSSAARADWTLRDSALQEQPHLNINTWDPVAGLSATSQSGKLVNFKTRDILWLGSAQPIVSDPASRAWRLTLNNGDVLYGDARQFTGKYLMFKIADLGELAIPLKKVSTLSSPVWGPASKGDRTKRIASAPDHDLVIFKETGDRLEGLVTNINDTTLSIGTDATTQPAAISLSKIDTVIFGGAKPPREIPPLSVRFSFTSGSVYTVPLQGDQPFNWKLGTLSVKDAQGKDHSVDTSRIASVEVLGGRLVYLTDLDFAKEDQTSFLDTSWPAQINKNVIGQPLKVSQTTFDRGIGVHTQSNLVYQLDGSFDTLSLRVGMDDSAAPLGEARVSIILDGKLLWPPDGPKLIKPGDLSDELVLPIKGGKHLEFHADPTDHMDVQGRVDWLNVALRRP